MYLHYKHGNCGETCLTVMKRKCHNENNINGPKNQFHFLLSPAYVLTFECEI